MAFHILVIVKLESFLFFIYYFFITVVTLQMSLFWRLIQQRGTCMCVSTCMPVFAYELNLNISVVDCPVTAWVVLVFLILSVVPPRTQLV